MACSAQDAAVWVRSSRDRSAAGSKRAPGRTTWRPEMARPAVVYTIGHSTRSLDELLALLHAHGITQLADVRTVPGSRRHPHFGGDALSRSLPAARITYRHFPGL